jgi:hypothetical protein
MRKLYYTVYKETIEIDSIFYLSGYKDITIYYIENNEIKFLFKLNLLLEQPTIENILKLIDDNGLIKHELIEL